MPAPLPSLYFCVGCDAPIPHPHDDESDCPTDAETGRCAFLIAAGAKPVWIRVHADYKGEMGRHLLSRGDWMCAQCVKRFGSGHGSDEAVAGRVAARDRGRR